MIDLLRFLHWFFTLIDGLCTAPFLLSILAELRRYRGVDLSKTRNFELPLDLLTERACEGPFGTDAKTPKGKVRKSVCA